HPLTILTCSLSGDVLDVAVKDSLVLELTVRAPKCGFSSTRFGPCSCGNHTVLGKQVQEVRALLNESVNHHCICAVPCLEVDFLGCKSTTIHFASLNRRAGRIMPIHLGFVPQ